MNVVILQYLNNSPSHPVALLHMLLLYAIDVDVPPTGKLYPGMHVYTAISPVG